MSTIPEEEKKSFTEHLEDLRHCLIVSAIAVAAGFVVCYFFKERLFGILMQPLVVSLPPKSTLIFTSLPEAFFTYLKVSLLGGIFLSAPLVLYQLWTFVSPGLYRNEKRYVIPFVLFSTIFFVGGALFGYFVVFPFGFKFFLGFTTEYIRPMPTIKEYFGFAAKLLFAFGVIFELPLFVLFLARIGLVNAKMMRKYRKYAILMVFVASAILTPPDVMTQLMMAGPLLILYEISVWVASAFGRKAKEKEEEEESEDREEADGAGTAGEGENGTTTSAEDETIVDDEDPLSPEEVSEKLDED